MRIVLAALLIAVPGVALAGLEQSSIRFNCERGVTVPVTFVSSPDSDDLAVVNLDGHQVVLKRERSASGARYGASPDVSGYALWIKGNAATVYWREGTDTQNETQILSACVAAE